MAQHVPLWVSKVTSEKKELHSSAQSTCILQGEILLPISRPRNETCEAFETLFVSYNCHIGNSGVQTPLTAHRSPRTPRDTSQSATRKLARNDEREKSCEFRIVACGVVPPISAPLLGKGLQVPKGATQSRRDLAQNRSYLEN